MPRYEALFRLEPPSIFGLPDGDQKVARGAQPGRPRALQADYYDASTFVQVGWGDMSEYRPTQEAIRKQFQLDKITCSQSDNFLTLTFEGADFTTAQATSRHAVEKLLRMLSLGLGVLVTFERIKLREIDGTDVLNYPGTAKFETTFWDLVQVSQELDAAVQAWSTADKTVDKAVKYHQHAQLLMRQVDTTASGLLDHLGLTISDILLSLWKAVSTILGDTTKGDDPAARCAALSLPSDYYDKKAKPIRMARNDYDVAHYTIDPSKGVMAQPLVAPAFETSRDVIRSYFGYLRKGGSSFDLLAKP
ncbi:MAG TPA: hypothetical protein VGV89_03295 [Thermoplasmata archaeon]|nr:hypothetical protein [Thermoplasmata archaeon]